MAFRRIALAALGLGLSLGGCDKESKSAPAASASAPAAEPAPKTAPAQKSYEIVQHLEGCEIHHRGLSIDVGTRSANARRGFEIGPFEDEKDVERDGASYGRMLDSRVAYDFWLDEDIEDLLIELRVHAIMAKRLHVVIDRRRVGTAKLNAGETRIVSFPSLKLPLSAGKHRIELRWSGRPRGVTEPYAEVDWIRIGLPDEINATYAAPTLRDVVTDVVLDGVPKTSLVLRAPSTVRCPVQLAPESKLQFSLGFWGSGKGAADVRIVADGEEPVTLLERKVTGGGGATWTPVGLDLSKYAGRVVGLELRALSSSRGGRVAFGDPAIVRAQGSEQIVPEASTVVLVIASALDRKRIPPWGPAAGLTSISELAKAGVAFNSFRAPSTVPGSSIASMLTGLPPRAHGLEDPAARLPKQAQLLSEIVKESGGRTAMFTGVPTTFGAFGFDSGWDVYESMSPVKDIAAAEPIVRATSWLEHELGEERAKRRLVVAHVRGAHPPWDLSREEASALPPQEYGGILDARRGAITLAKVRSRRSHSQRRLDEEDWKRLFALEHAALLKQDAALQQLFALLKKKGEWEKTLFVLASDVAPGEGPEPPFDPAAPLAEQHLLVPLIVKFPGPRVSAKETSSDVTAVDVAATTLAALRLDAPANTSGRDLYSAAVGQEPLAGRAIVSTLADHYSTLFGHWRLSGQIGRTPKLCQLDVDPACVADVLETMPVAAQAIWRVTFVSESAALDHRIAPREPASIDPDTGAALTVWGDIY